MVERLAAVGRDQYQVLNAHAEFPRQIDARLDGEGHALLHHLRVGRRDRGLLMQPQPDAVPQAMGEIFAVAAGCDVVAGSGIDVAETHARADGLFSRQYCF